MLEDLTTLIQSAGYLGLFFIIFAESGLFFGFFLPGDSLLFTAGFLASQGYFNIWLLAPLMFIAAVLGDNVGYWTGQKYGRELFERKNSMFFRKEYLLQAEAFYERHGKKTITLARFIPAVRTFAPIVAGIARMDYKAFLAYNLLGGVLWGLGMTLAGYFLGRVIPNADELVLPIVAGIIVISIVPALLHFNRGNEAKKRGWKL